MMTSIVSLFIQLVCYLIEFYLFLSFLRLVLSRTDARNSQYYIQSKLVTDPMPNAIKRLLSRWVKPLPNWFAWVIIIAAACVMRQVLFIFVSA